MESRLFSLAAVSSVLIHSSECAKYLDSVVGEIFRSGMVDFFGFWLAFVMKKILCAGTNSSIEIDARLGLTFAVWIDAKDYDNY